MKVKYKDFRIGKYLFTVKFIKYETFINFNVMPVHDHPHNKWQRIKEFFKIKIYTSQFWYPEGKKTLRETVAECLEEIIEDMEHPITIEQTWKYL